MAKTYDSDSSNATDISGNEEEPEAVDHEPEKVKTEENEDDDTSVEQRNGNDRPEVREIDTKLVTKGELTIKISRKLLVTSPSASPTPKETSKRRGKGSSTEDGNACTFVVRSYVKPGVRYSDDSPGRSDGEDSSSTDKKTGDVSDVVVGGTSGKRKNGKTADGGADSSPKKRRAGRRKGQPRKILKTQRAKFDSGAKGRLGSGKSKSDESSRGRTTGEPEGDENCSGVLKDGKEDGGKPARRRKGRPRKILNIKDAVKDDDDERKDDANGEEKEDSEEKRRSRRKERVMCEKCGKTVSRMYMARHLYHIHSSQTFQCDKCRRVLRTEKAYQHHLIVKHSDDSPHKCPICGTGLSSSRALSHHLTRLHGSPDDKPFQCTVCEKRFLLKNDLQLHMASHSDEKPFVCETCGKGFNNKGSLKTHYRIHTGEKPYQCHFCGQRFSFKNSLQGHERRHTGETPYLCSFCGKGFPTRPALLKHSIVHSDERPFKCTQCEKTFRSRPAFTTHKDFHLGIKRWECKVCKRRFLFQGNMLKHSRRHLADRPHVCEVCGKGFVQKQELKTHMRVHTGEARPKGRKQKAAAAAAAATPTGNKTVSSVPTTTTAGVLTQGSDGTGNVFVHPDNKSGSGGGSMLPQNYSYDKADAVSACQFNQNPSPFAAEKQHGQQQAHQSSVIQQNQYKMPNLPLPFNKVVPNMTAAGGPMSGCCDMPYANMLQHADAMQQAIQSNAVPMMNVPQQPYHQSSDIELLQTPVNPFSYIEVQQGMQNHHHHHQHHASSYDNDKQQQKAAPAASAIIRCKLCNKDFTTHRYIRKHLIEYHRVNNPEDFFFSLS